MHIEHLTLNTGHVAHQTRAQISDEALCVVSAWLRTVIGIGQPTPVPGSDGCNALALVQQGALVVTVYGPVPELGAAPPLATFGVATRSRHAGHLWRVMASQPGVYPHACQPSPPWCAVLLYLPLAGDPAAAAWLGDFERTVAWAWVTRHPALEVVHG